MVGHRNSQGEADRYRDKGDGRTEQKGCCVVAGQLCAGRLGSEGPAKVTSLLGLGRELSKN